MNDGALVVEVKVNAPAHTLTQPPVLGANGATLNEETTFEKLVPYKKTAPHRYPDLPNSWRVAVEEIPGAPESKWPWRASLARATMIRSGRRRRASATTASAPSGESMVTTSALALVRPQRIRNSGREASP